jgi:glutamate dehydrogenase/leucine dehydrogenase
MIEDKIITAFQNTVETAEAHNTDWRTSAYIVGIKRVAVTYKERGIYP